MAKALGKYSVVLCAGHGAATVSNKGPEHAIQRLMTLEQLCKMNWLAFTAVGKDYERYAFDDATMKKHFKMISDMQERHATPERIRP